MNTKFNTFIETLKNSDNVAFIESVKGALALIEGYADVRDEPNQLSAFDRYTNLASSASSVMSQIQQSDERLASHYSIDTEPELDFNDTSSFNRAFYDEPNAHVYDEIEDSLGLTAGDLEYNQRQMSAGLDSDDEAFDLSSFDA
jgi:hypothetical protein